MLSRTLVVTDSTGLVHLDQNGHANLHDFPTRCRVDFDLTPTAYLFPTSTGGHPGVGPFVQGRSQFSIVIDITCYTIDYDGDPAAFNFQSVIDDCPFGTIAYPTPCFTERLQPVDERDNVGPVTTINSYALVLRCHLFFGYDVVNKTYSAFVIPRLQDDNECGLGTVYDWNIDYAGSSAPWLGKYVTGLGPRDQVVFEFPDVPPPAGMLSPFGVSEWVGTVHGKVTLTPLCNPCTALTVPVQPPCGCVQHVESGSSSSGSSSSSSQNHSLSQSSESSSSSKSSDSSSSSSRSSRSSASSESSHHGGGGGVLSSEDSADSPISSYSDLISSGISSFELGSADSADSADSAGSLVGSSSSSDSSDSSGSSVSTGSSGSSSP